MKEISAEIYEFVYSKKGFTLGLKTYFAQSESKEPVALANWLELGGKGGEAVTVEKIPQFFNKESSRLNCQPEDILPELKIDIEILNEAKNFDSESGRNAAKRYFLRQLASQWYTFEYDPSLVMHTNTSPSETIIECSLKALQLI